MLCHNTHSANKQNLRNPIMSDTCVCIMFFSFEQIHISIAFSSRSRFTYTIDNEIRRIRVYIFAV